MTDNNTFTVEVNGKELEIRMSYGMLNELAGHLGGDLDIAANLALQDEIREAVMISLLTPRTNTGKLDKNKIFNPFTDDIDPDQVSDLLAWTGDHLTDFLLKCLEKAQTSAMKHVDRVKALQSISTGGQV